ncbi:hypothetical protein [Myroides sp. DW712]|uniref:hypothetical protein n=1 Tax=Myroides sp. DW712 TaxID=3389800 RepID=UPI00397BAEA3
MNTSRGKKINFIPIILVLILLSAGSSWLSSIAIIPTQMGRALVASELYTGPLERITDEQGNVQLGIVTTGATGEAMLIPAERLDDITLEYFREVNQAVLVDEASGGTFWLTYEDLLLSYGILVVVFFVARIAVFLVLYLLHTFALIGNQTATAIKKSLHLLIKPMRMLALGYVLWTFYQFRIFGSEEEAELFSVFMLIYALYFLFVIGKRLWAIRHLGAFRSPIEESAYQTKKVVHSAYETTRPETDQQVLHDNDLIKRKKITFKHQTSRYT